MVVSTCPYLFFVINKWCKCWIINSNFCLLSGLPTTYLLIRRPRIEDPAEPGERIRDLATTVRYHSKAKYTPCTGLNINNLKVLQSAVLEMCLQFLEQGNIALIISLSEKMVSLDKVT